MPLAGRPGEEPLGRRLRQRLHQAEVDTRALGLWLAVAAIWLGFDLLTAGLFLSPRNLYNLAIQSSAVAVMASGMVFVLVARHVDLSVGSVLGFTGLLVALLQAEVFPAEAAWGWPAALAIGMALGAAIGAWQGYWVAYRGVPAFVVTLAGLLCFRGATYLLTDGRTVAPLHPAFERLGGGIGGSLGAFWSLALASAVAATGIALRLRERARRRQHGVPLRPAWAEAAALAAQVIALLGFAIAMNAYTAPGTQIARGIPLPLVLLGAVALSMTLLAGRTRFGRHVWAIGGNPEAAALCGIDVRRTTLGVFVAMSLLAAVAGALTTARLGAGTSAMGTLAELEVIAAAVIGGTSLAGGSGRVGSAIVGAVIMQSLENGLVLLGVSSAARQILAGLVLIAAVWIDSIARRAQQAA
jgi:D-xylose transport system permease protein